MCNICLSRRGLFSGMGGLAAMTAIGAVTAGSAMAQPVRSAETPDAALARLMEGNARYASGQMSERDFSAGPCRARPGPGALRRHPRLCRLAGGA